MSELVRRITRSSSNLHADIRAFSDSLGTLLVDAFHHLALFAIGATTVWSAVGAFLGMVGRGRALDRAGKTLATECRELVDGGLLGEKEAAEVLGRVSLILEGDEAISTAQYIIEAVPESLDLKRNVFERCGSLSGPETVVASNTSTMSISDIAARMNRPERAVVTHWFIPPHLMPVVEVVPGTGTSEQTVQLTKALLQKVGKRPVVCKENPGFIHNYIQLANYTSVPFIPPYLRPAARLV